MYPKIYQLIQLNQVTNLTSVTNMSESCESEMTPKESKATEAEMISVPCALFTDGDNYHMRSLDGKLDRVLHKVDVAPQCRFVRRKKADMPFFFRVYYGEEYDEAELEKVCREHGLTEMSAQAYIDHCRDAHPCLVMPVPGTSLQDLLDDIPEEMRKLYLARHPANSEFAQWDFWFNNMGTPVFFPGEKALPTTGNRMEIMVDAYFIAYFQDCDSGLPPSS